MMYVVNDEVEAVKRYVETGYPCILGGLIYYQNKWYPASQFKKLFPW
jgi:hypothetical protein